MEMSSKWRRDVCWSS